MSSKENRNTLNESGVAELILENDGYTIFTPNISELSIPSPEGSTDDETSDIDAAQKLEGEHHEEGEIDLKKLIDDFNWHIKLISNRVIGREDVLHQALYAILTGEHMLLLGRTGTAKSFMVNYIFSIFDNARIFSSQASKDQTPDNYFGPYNIDEFKRGRIRHNIQGSIIEADLVFLDEFFDASDIVLRSLLSVLNERKFINGPEMINAAVHSAIATANYMRMNEVTEAVLDRFLYKSIIPEDSNMYSQFLIDHTYAEVRGETVSQANPIPFDRLRYIHNIIKNKDNTIKIEIPDTILFMKNVIINKFTSSMRKDEPQFFISPRKQAKISDFLRATALLDNRFEVSLDDLKNMYLPLCTLNSYMSTKIKDKSEKDTFLDTHEQTMIYFHNTGALQQIEYLLKAKKILQMLKDSPESGRNLGDSNDVWMSLKNLFSKIFPSKTRDNEELTEESLKKTVLDIKPALGEVQELKDGILKNF